MVHIYENPNESTLILDDELLWQHWMFFLLVLVIG